MHTTQQRPLPALLALSFLMFPLLLWAEQPAHPSKSTLFQQANLLLKQKNFSALYTYLLPHELSYAGNEHYDYLLGLAALESDKANIAVQILQRAVDMDAMFSGARMALARAYYSTGDYERARHHFELLLLQEPPEQAQTVIKQYLINIDLQAKKYTPHLYTWFEGSLGYDTNANASTEQDLFYGFKLDDKNIETASSFASLNAGSYYSHPITAQSRFAASTNIGHRANPSASYVDLTYLSIDGQFHHKFEPFSAYGFLRTTATLIDNDFNQQSIELHSGLDYIASQTVNFNVHLTIADQQFTDELSIQDTMSYAIWLTSTKTTKSNSLVGFSVGLATDDSSQTDSPYSNNKVSARLFYRIPVSNALRANFQLASYQTDYDEEPGFFGEIRKDKRYSGSAALTWLNFIGEQWQMTARLSLTNHQSNVSLYEFQRAELGLSVRKTFE